MKTITLMIDGMTCSACSSGLEKYLRKQNGIKEVSVNLVMGNARVEYDDTLLSQKQIEIYVKEAGFQSLGLWKDTQIEQEQTKANRVLLLFTILAIALLYICMGHMIGLPAIPYLEMHQNPIHYTVTIALITILFLWYGRDILKSGWNHLIHKMPNMDTLVGIGVMSSFLYSMYYAVQIIRGNTQLVDSLYFESAAIVIYFIQLGRYMDKRSKNKTKEAIEQLVQMTPKEAYIKQSGKEQKVTIDEIQKGDIVICRPGEKIAVDGIITDGTAHMDESFITGESKQQKKVVGDTVIAGSFNYDGYLEYQAERIGKDSTISEIVRLVVDATNTKPPIATLADQVSGYFVPTVIGLAIITFFVYLIIGNPFSEAFHTFVTILVVACPCSLGLATPLAIIIGEGIGAKNGILIKKSEVLEMAQKIDTVIFDKTGTITYGSPKMEQIICYDAMEEQNVIQMVGSLEKKSVHPIGKAFTDYLSEHKITDIKVENVQEISGYGIVGTIQEEEILVGNAKLLQQYHIENSHLKDEKKLTANQNSVVYVVKNKKIIALIGVNDIIRKDVKQVIQLLQKRHIKTIMLTGDHEETANRIAKQVGIDHVIANVLPSEKANVIASYQKEKHHVMMCGDGMNDSPALASADIGVSIHSGNDIATNTADVILMQDHLYGIVNLIHMSEKTIRNIKQNLFWAFFYNILMIPLAMGIFRQIGITMNPMIASLSMTLSSVTVMVNALRLKKIKFIQ